ncbi:MAG: hypothetical protein ACXIUM_08830 [Wenzhouxiangella sp.]
MFKPKTRRHQERRRGIVRTALVLAGIVLLVYLYFVARAVFSVV